MVAKRYKVVQIMSGSVWNDYFKIEASPNYLLKQADRVLFEKHYAEAKTYGVDVKVINRMEKQCKGY